jgi:L-cysteine/cystine lyase
MVLAKRRRLKLKYANLENGYVDYEEAFKEVISSKTRMILISDVTFATGARADLKAISKIAHENDILVIVDGVQAVGNYPIDVQELGVDGYAMARHKFLFGPDGAGALYVNKKVFPKILPTYSGVFTDSEHGMSGKLVLMETAQRYEVSTRPVPVIMGGTAAIKWLNDKVGWDLVYRKSKENFNILWDAISDIKGVQLLTERDQSGILTFSIEGIEPINIVNQLNEKNIFTRTIIVTKPQAVRISIGVWNRESDLDTIAQSIETIAKKA